MSKYQRTWALLAPYGAVLLIGCGGATPEPETPVDESPTESAPPPPTDDASDDEDTGQMDNDGGSSSEPLSPEDFQAALQAVIQDDALQNAMNLTEPGRFPIKISGAELPSNLELVAATKAVEVVETPEDPKTEPVLVFSKIERIGSRVSFKYRYDIEGVRGTSTVVKKDGVWELKASRISEY